jgi:hypothetical protein
MESTPKVEGARSKSWDEIKAAGLRFYFVITVCDKA